MPTTRPRHLITETDQVSRALTVAAKRWPDESNSRSKLLVRLLEEGRRALDNERDHAEHSRRETVARTSGALTGVYAADYLAELREDWPD